MNPIQTLFLSVFAAIALIFVVLDPSDFAGFGFAIGFCVSAMLLFRVRFLWMLAAGLVLWGSVLLTPNPTGTLTGFLIGVFAGGVAGLGLKLAIAWVVRRPGW